MATDCNAPDSARCSRLRIALGTWIAIEAEAPAVEQARGAVDAAYAAALRVDRLMHPSRDGSDLARLHVAPVHDVVRVDPWTAECLELALLLHERTRGVFDPVLPTSNGTVAALEVASPATVVRHRPVRLDLGGIAKGFAVDRAIDVLRAHGCSAGLVNAGGDLRTFGRDEQVWLRAAGGAREVALRDEALAATEFGPRARPAEHAGYHVRGRPRRDRGLIAVRAPQAAIADALTKVLGTVLSPEQEKSVLTTFGAALVEACGSCRELR